MTTQSNRALVPERGPGFYALWGLGLSLPIAAVWGYLFNIFGSNHYPLVAAFEATLFFGWIGAPLGGLIGFLVEFSRPTRQRRMLTRNIR